MQEREARDERQRVRVSQSFSRNLLRNKGRLIWGKKDQIELVVCRQLAQGNEF